VVPVKTSHQGERRKAQTQAAEPPEVGIFWLVDGKLVIDRTALSKAENYGAFKVHPGDHCSVWEKLQRGGVVPSDMEYEKSPRGRVMYDKRTGRFRLLADRCILRNKGAIRRIMSAMKLPNKNTDKGTDAHYRCSACLRSWPD
jgi:hypothetical protein